MSEQRNKRGPGICYNFQRGECDRGNSCRYLHDKQGERSGGTERYGGGRSRRGVCYSFQRGECNRGDSCRYAHDDTKPTDRGNGSTSKYLRTRYKSSTNDSKYSRDRWYNKERSQVAVSPPEKPSWTPSPSPPGSWAAIVAADPPKNENEVLDDEVLDNDAQVFDED